MFFWEIKFFRFQITEGIMFIMVDIQIQLFHFHSLFSHIYDFPVRSIQKTIV